MVLIIAGQPRAGEKKDKKEPCIVIEKKYEIIPPPIYRFTTLQKKSSCNALKNEFHMKTEYIVSEYMNASAGVFLQTKIGEDDTTASLICCST